MTETAPPPTADVSTAKYIPPARRRMMEEERKRLETMGPSPPQYDGMIQREPSKGPSSACTSRPSMPTSIPPPRGSVPDRWKVLNDEDGWDPRPSTSRGRWNELDGRSSSDHPGGHRQSQTGTGWDIRDGRRWRPENMEEIFKKDKDKSTGINFGRYDEIPVELSGNNHESIDPLTSFREARGVHPLLMENIIRVEYERPTPVQKYSISAILAGRDLMACAQTGSGKTAAFLFPVITKTLNEGPPPDVVNKDRYRTRMPSYPVALVLSPTRELAIQIYEESRKYAYRTGIRTVVVYGGSEVRSQLCELENGCDICVATPGRLSDIMKRGKVCLKLTKYLILDEADRMLDMGFSPQIYSIVTEYDMPTSKEGRQTVMFSATFPRQIQELASEFLHDYLFLTVGRVGSTNDFIQQYLLYADEDSKPKKLLKLLEEAKGLVLVFVETRKKADLIEDFLIGCDLPAVTIHGDKSQNDRETALRKFRNGERSILVATDVAARGLDIHNIEHVINCDLPSRIEDYVHRIGRTGRAGNRGKATSFVNEGNRGMLRELLSLLEEAGQAVPDWFYQMIRQCTSAYRGGFGGGSGGGTFGRRGGHRAPGFGSRDMRSSTSMVSKNNSSGGVGRFGSSPDIVRGPLGKTSAVAQDDDVEDGW